MISFIFRSPKSPTRICQKCSQRLERSQRVQGSGALLHCFRVSLHFLREVASASKTVADLLVGELREQPSDPFGVAPGYMFCQFFHFCPLPIVRNIDRGQKKRTAMQFEIDFFWCRFFEEL